MLKNILIYHVGQLGDTLVSIPAINAIKAKHQNCRIVLLTDKHPEKKYVSSWDVLKITSHIDQVVFYDPSKISQFKYLFSFLKTIKAINPTDIYNLVLRINLRSKWRDYLFFKIILGAKNYTDVDIIKYPPLKDMDGKLVNLSPQWLRLLKKVDRASNIDQIQLPIHEKSLKSLELLLDDHLFESGKLRIVFGPGSKMSSKCWPEESFIELGIRLINAYPNLEILIVGGSEDYKVAKSLLESWNMSNANNYCGKLSIGESAELIRKCDMYIGNDTGTMHLAAMAGIMCVAIFSARDYPGLWEPFGDQHITIRKNIKCAGCMLASCSEYDNACLKLIGVDEVFSAVVSKLSTNA
jgi:ADP-heptose:LPS heptosyltransferase